MLELGAGFKDDEWDDGNMAAGTIPYNDYMTEEEWVKEFEGYCGMGSAPSDRYYIPLPVWTGGNVFFNGAKPCEKEKDFVEDKEHEIYINLIDGDGDWKIDTNIYDYVDSNAKLITTETLGVAFEPEQKYENPDGTPITFDTDIYGRKRTVIKAGPIA